MKIKFELGGWFPEMVKALKKNRKSDADYNQLCKVMVESWLIDHEESFRLEFESLKKKEGGLTSNMDELEQDFEDEIPKENCPSCDGIGLFDDSTTCQTCDGEGLIEC